MDVAKTLVRRAMRAFYTTQEILVIDALVTHSALLDLDLSYLLKINTKDLHKLCASLRDARFLVVHSRPEMLEGKTRPISRTYYYIDYRQTIDAIKWRVHKIDKDMQIHTQPADETKEYTCPRCQAQWTQMEVLDSYSPQGFLCGRCDSVLELSKEREAPGHQQLSRMNNQFKFMTDLLQQIDRMVIPECTFENAIQHARPIVRESTHEVQQSISVEYSAHNKPSALSAVKGLTDTGPKTMQVTISDGNEQETLENRKRKERLAAENALPSWITNSSVPTTGVGISTAGTEEEKDGLAANKIKSEIDLGAEEEDDDDLIFEDVGPSSSKKVKAEAGAGEEEDDDIDFEDVV